MEKMMKGTMKRNGDNSRAACIFISIPISLIEHSMDDDTSRAFHGSFMCVWFYVLDGIQARMNILHLAQLVGECYLEVHCLLNSDRTRILLQLFANLLLSLECAARVGIGGLVLGFFISPVFYPNTRGA